MAEDSFKAALIGPAFYGKLKETIAKVDGRPIGSGGTKIPTDLGGDGGGFVPKTFRIATFTGAWSIGSDKTVTLASDTSQTLTATNLFFPVPAPKSTATRVNCTIAKDGTAWCLINVPLATATAVFVGSTASRSIFSADATTSVSFVQSFSAQTAAYVTNISAKLDTSNCTIIVSTTTATASSVTAVSTQTGTFVSLAGTQTITMIGATFTMTFLRVDV